MPGASRPKQPDFLTVRAGFWHYARRVPLAYSEIDPRGVIRQSTKIRVADDPRGAKARRAVERINDELEAFWRTTNDGDAAAARNRYDKARKTARRLGFEYLPAAEVAALPVSEILQRVEVLAGPGAGDDRAQEEAALGGAPVPMLSLDGLFAEYEKLTLASRKEYSPNQIRKWRNPKRRAVANLISVIGDKEIAKVTRADAVDFQAWWQDRVLIDGVQIETANKDIGHLNKMFRTIETRHRLGLGPVFAQLRIEGGTTGQRVAFDPAFVQTKLLAAGALDGLNDEARDVLLVMAETGMRITEVCNLTEATIKLDAPVPHVMARPDGRRMKTEQSSRDMPLVGVALEAMHRRPNGFPRYRDKADSLSATVNKYLSENSLLPEEGQSLYSLRHTFEDRLTAVEAPDKIAAALMGHKYHRPRYGRGPSLAQKLEWLGRIVFQPPGVCRTISDDRG